MNDYRDNVGTKSSATVCMYTALFFIFLFLSNNSYSVPTCLSAYRARHVWQKLLKLQPYTFMSQA